MQVKTTAARTAVDSVELAQYRFDLGAELAPANAVVELTVSVRLSVERMTAALYATVVDPVSLATLTVAEVREAVAEFFTVDGVYGVDRHLREIRNPNLNRSARMHAVRCEQRIHEAFATGAEPLPAPISAPPAPGESCTDPEWLRAVVATLTYGELALAINASDMPTDRPTNAKEDPLACAVDGLARLGVDGVRKRLDLSTALVDQKYHGADRQTRRDAGKAHRELWGGERRYNRSHTLAGRYWHGLA